MKTTTSDAGSVTLWSLGLAVIVLMLGALSLDLWATLAARQRLQALADATAFAAASGIDEDRLRQDGVVVLDPASVGRRAQRALDMQELPAAWRGWDLAVARDAVTVEVRGHVDGSLLPLIGFEGLDVVVTSRAAPVLLP